MRTYIRMLVMVLLLTMGTAPVAVARGGAGGSFPGGFHGGGLSHGAFHQGFHRGGFEHFHQPHFHGGIFVEPPLLWVAPAPDVEVTPAPPSVWYYCTTPPGYYPAVPSCAVPWMPVYPP